MPVATTLKVLGLAAAIAEVDAGAAFVDLRPTDPYLDAHVPGSIALGFEKGPGMASRARDCLPLDLELILLDHGDVDVMGAAAALRGKGFSVIGSVRDGTNEWANAGRTLASTDVERGPTPPQGVVLDVGDPGLVGLRDSVRVPVDTLWSRRTEFLGASRIVIAAGLGVRAALAVGILEYGGAHDIAFWKTRPSPLPSLSR